MLCNQSVQHNHLLCEVQNRQVCGGGREPDAQEIKRLRTVNGFLHSTYKIGVRTILFMGVRTARKFKEGSILLGCAGAWMMDC